GAMYLVRYLSNGKFGSAVPISLGKSFGVTQLVPMGGRRMILVGYKTNGEDAEPGVFLVDENGAIEKQLDIKEPLQLDEKGKVSAEDIRRFDVSQARSEEHT